jgi:hypothetical protein
MISFASLGLPVRMAMLAHDMHGWSVSLCNAPSRAAAAG